MSTSSHPTPSPKRALVVVDVQNEYDGGALAIRHPPFAETVANVSRAMAAATEAGIPIVVVRQTAPKESPTFAAGSHGAAPHPAIADAPHDHTVDKALPSAFTGTDLEAWLRARGVDTVVVAGYMTHNCDLSTIVHALHMGFAVEFLSDASGSIPYANAAGIASAEEIHRVICVVLQSRFAAVVSTDAWIAAVREGTVLERDTIVASHRRALAADLANHRTA
ncbi:MAG: cysteine hydrolase [Phyllobacteriaceae bacterium]|nr:cysteine hydrolase [Phyllobacteriaceae bacterium]